MIEPVATQAAVEYGERFVLALSQKNERALRDALSPGVRFRGLTPGNAWEANTQGEAIAILFGSWFEPADHIEDLVSHEVHAIADRVAIRYCFRIRNADGLFVVEQQAFASPAEDGRIADIAIVCSGYRPISDTH